MEATQPSTMDEKELESSSTIPKTKQNPKNKERRTSTSGSNSSSSIISSNKNYGVKLIRFFIYNPSFGPKEGQEAQKILFFYDADSKDAVNTVENHDRLDQQIKHVGLTEAAIRFASVFSQDSDSCALGMHTQKTKSVYLEAEKGYYMVLTVTVPRTKRRKHSRTAEHSSASTYEYAYSPDDVHENVLRAILIRSYDMFKLFSGGFQHQLSNNSSGNVECFKENIKAFFRKYVTSSIMSIIDKADLNISLFGGVQFLTLQSSAFLKVHSFISRIEDQFRPNIEAALFLHQGNIVWSGLQQKETALLFQYINTSLLPNAAVLSTPDRQPNIASSTDASTSRNPFSGHQGRFLTGSNVNRSLVDIKMPRIFIPPPSTFATENYKSIKGENEIVFKEYHLIVYHAISSTVCLIIPAEIEISNGIMNGLDAYMGSRLTNMSADLLDVLGRGNFHISSSTSNPTIAYPPFSPLTSHATIEQNLKDLGFSSTGSGDNSNNSNVRFLYYNATNKAMKNTLLIYGVGKSGTSSIPTWSLQHSNSEHPAADSDESALRDEIHVIADMRNHFDKISSRW